MLWSEGERNGDTLRDAVRAVLQAEPMVDSIDYVSVAHMLTLDELEQVEDQAMVSTAVRMGVVRLIDNIVLR